MVEEQNNNNEDGKDESNKVNNSENPVLEHDIKTHNSRLNTIAKVSKDTTNNENTSSLLDDSVNNSSTSEDSGIFSSSNLGHDSGLQTPSTSPPPRRPIYAAKAKEDCVNGDESKKKSPLFDFKHYHNKSNARPSNSINANERSSSPSSTSSDDSSMLDMVSRAAIYDEIYKLDD